MADTKITALAAIATVDPAADVLPIVDISDTSMAASGTTKKVTSNQILGAGGTATLASATITGALTVDTSTLTVDATNDRVGIGTATPADTLDVNGRVTALRYLSSSSSASLPSYAVAAGNGIYNSGSNQIGFAINSANAMTLNATGNLVFPSAKGIDFSAVTGGTGTTTANVLNDYEEGTWTPVVTAVSGTLTSVTGQVGRYTKIGRMVMATGFFTITTNGTGSSAVAVAGLPFTVGDMNSIGVGRVDGTTGNMFQIKLNAFTATGNIWTYNNLYPAADGAQFPMTLVYYV